MLELIVDRSQAHVDLLKRLRAKSWGSMTAAEREAWYSEAARGAYNYTDLNRVESAVAELSETLGLGLTTKTNWTAWDIPCKADMTRYLGNIKAIVDACPDKVFPELPESMDNLTVEAANNIEYSLLLAAGEIETDVEISMVDGTNVAGDPYFNATAKMGGTFENGKFMSNATGYLTVPIYYLNNSDCWTVAFTIDTFTPSSTISYLARGNAGVPSVSYYDNYDLFLFSLTTSSNVTNSNCEWYDPLLAIRGGYSNLAFNLYNDRKNTLVFRNDGTYISLWVNGSKKATQLTTKYTEKYHASSFSLGDNRSVDFSPNNFEFECSMLKAWRRALTDEEISNLG